MSGRLSGIWPWRRRTAAAAPAMPATAQLRSDRFRLEREADWRRLETIVATMERGRLAAIPDADLLALPGLYRTASSSLAVARETMLDAAALDYLEGLLQRAWYQVYGPRQGIALWLRRFLAGGWARGVRAIAPDIAIAAAVMVLGTIVGWLLCAGDPEWFHRLLPPDLAQGREPGAGRDVLQQALTDRPGADTMTLFAAFLFQHNAQVTILAFALGFAFGIPTLLLLIHNMVGVGALLWLYHGEGLGLELFAWLAVHGTTELFAILLGGAAGLHVGRALAFPGQAGILPAAAAAGQRAAVVMTGAVVMLVVAAGLEGFTRQIVTATADRLMVGGAMLALWLAYFCLAGRERSGTGAGTGAGAKPVAGADRRVSMPGAPGAG